ncbi:hypothetical protein WAE56_12505 [Iodobacter sp. LRB]
MRWRFGPLEWLIATPAFRHWHHANEAEGQVRSQLRSHVSFD